MLKCKWSVAEWWQHHFIKFSWWWFLRTLPQLFNHLDSFWCAKYTQLNTVYLGKNWMFASHYRGVHNIVLLKIKLNKKMMVHRNIITTKNRENWCMNSKTNRFSFTISYLCYSTLSHSNILLIHAPVVTTQ